MRKAGVCVKTSGCLSHRIFFFFHETGLCKSCKTHVYDIFGGTGTFFWRGRNVPVTAHVCYSRSCIFLTVNLQTVIRLHASRQKKKSLLPAVTLGVRDKEQSSNQPASRFTTGRSLLLLSRAQPRTVWFRLPFVSKSFNAAAQRRTWA